MSEISTNIEQIDSAKAANYLRFNNGNRKLKEKRVRSYADQMRKGEWDLNGQAIIFDKTGQLVDGQHRLKAIIKSGANLPFVVVRGVNQGSNLTVDVGAKRSLKDALDILGEKSTTVLGTVIVCYITTQRGNYSVNVGTTFGFSVKQSMEVFNDNPEYFRALARLAQKEVNKSPNRVINVTQYTTVLLMISGGVYNQHHIDFMKHLTGSMNIEGTGASWLVRMVSRAKQRKESLQKRWFYAMAVKAWNNYINGNPVVSHMYYNIEKPFPEIEKLKTIKQGFIEAGNV